MAEEFISALAVRGRSRRRKGRIPFNAEVARKVGVGTGERNVGSFLKHHIARALKVATINVVVTLEDQGRAVGNRHGPARAETCGVIHREGVAVRKCHGPREGVIAGNLRLRRTAGDADRESPRPHEIRILCDIERTDRLTVIAQINTAGTGNVETARRSERRVGPRRHAAGDVRDAGIDVLV